MAERKAPKADAPEPLLALVKTRLELVDDELRRLNSEGGVLLRLPLASVRSVEFRRGFNWSALIFWGVSVAVALVAYFVSQYNWLSTLLYIAAILVFFFGLICFREDQIVVTTGDGETVIDCPDMTDEGKCFVTSMREILHRDGIRPRD